MFTKKCLSISTLILLFAGITSLYSCGTSTAHPSGGESSDPNPVSDPDFIRVDTANKMIASYLNSINYTQNDTDLRSLIIDADTLRTYLANSSIKKVKIMFAHTLAYINSGHGNQPAGYKNTALTTVIAGYDASGNYVFYRYPESSVDMVLDHSMPCPTNCPTSGTAASDLLPTR